MIYSDPSLVWDWSNFLQTPQHSQVLVYGSVYIIIYLMHTLCVYHNCKSSYWLLNKYNLFYYIS